MTGWVPDPFIRPVRAGVQKSEAIHRYLLKQTKPEKIAAIAPK
jgi:hypothetical protein